jgi:tRNA threonylcarbamoyladenosine biosynthesis protein TsaE
MFRLTIPSTEKLEESARVFLQAFPEDKLFAFYGEMGAGKTTFIKAICRSLGVGDVTSSPSFGLIHEYLTGEGDSIFHFDFYRIETLEEVFDIGYEEYMFSGSYCFMEWPEKVETILPDHTIRISINIFDEGMRELVQLS